MKVGSEYSSEWGETVIVLRASEILDVVYFTDELLFVDELPIGAFLDKYKPTGRVNTALKTLFNEKNFERKENDTNRGDFATPEGIQKHHKL